MTNTEVPFLDMFAQLRDGHGDAAAIIFHRFGHRLIALARQRLDPILGSRLDPEDVVQSVFRSFFRRCGDGYFTLGDWDNVWSVLACIAVRKCVGRKIARTDAPNAGAIRVAFDREPSPDETAAVLDTIAALMRGLEPHEQAMLALRLQGNDTREISEELHCTMRKVQRVLQHVGRRL